MVDERLQTVLTKRRHAVATHAWNFSEAIGTPGIVPDCVLHFLVREILREDPWSGCRTLRGLAVVRLGNEPDTHLIAKLNTDPDKLTGSPALPWLAACMKNLARKYAEGSRTFTRVDLYDHGSERPDDFCPIQLPRPTVPPATQTRTDPEPPEPSRAEPVVQALVYRDHLAAEAVWGGPIPDQLSRMVIAEHAKRRWDVEHQRENWRRLRYMEKLGPDDDPFWRIHPTGAFMAETWGREIPGIPLVDLLRMVRHVREQRIRPRREEDE